MTCSITVSSQVTQQSKLSDVQVPRLATELIKTIGPTDYQYLITFIGLWLQAIELNVSLVHCNVEIIECT